ncbi:MAG: ribosome maturation factor RimM [Candidatus Sulfobium sp.]
MRARNSGIRGQTFNDSDLTALAKLLKERGIKGEIKALPLSPKIAFLRPGSTVYLSSDAGLRRATVSSIRPVGKHFGISFLGVDDVESAARYRNSFVKVTRESIPREKGEFFWDELIGLTVITGEGTVIGKVQDILETGSNDVYIVRGGGREYLIPAIRDVIKKIDPVRGRILIEVMEGMLD